MSEAVPTGLGRLDHLGVIEVRGEDASSFLHGQLTQDIALMPDEHARWAGYCSAKGRLLASFLVVKRSPQHLLLVCAADLLAPTLKRLSMYVLRAKARLADVSSAWPVYGILGTVAGAEPFVCRSSGDAQVIALAPVDGISRELHLGPLAPGHAQVSEEAAVAWRYLEVRSGVAMVSLPVVEAFVPQMLNHESVGAVNFKKGCYPGQEVVARSQFRGTLKRRAYLVSSSAELHAGNEVYSALETSQPVGLVAQAAPDPRGGWIALVSIQVSAATAELRCPTPDGAVLTMQELPYTLLADV